MRKATVEFSRPIPVDRIPRGGSYEKIKAESAECVAVAKRLGIPAVHALTAEIRATPWRGGGLKLDGFLVADLHQVSVVSLEPFRSEVRHPVLRYFLPPGAVNTEEEDDADPIEHGEVDLGEVVTETLALELDPYPRKEGEAFEEHIESVDEEPEKLSPFADLTKLTPG